MPTVRHQGRALTDAFITKISEILGFGLGFWGCGLVNITRNRIEKLTLVQ